MVMAKLIYTLENGLLVHNAKNILSAAGIKVDVRNEIIGGITGDAPPIDCWPQLWLLDMSQEAKAMILLETIENQELGEPWLCQACQESNESSFEICWNCQAENENI